MPVFTVAAEVQLLRLPLLALPEHVELGVGEQLDVGGSISGLDQRRVGGGLKVGALCSGLGPGYLLDLHLLLSSLGLCGRGEPSSMTGQSASFAQSSYASPGSNRTAEAEVCESRSEAKAAASVSIGGKVP